MNFFKRRRETTKETTTSLKGQLGNMARLYKKNHTLNFIKVSAIVFGVLFAIGHTMYRAHFFNMPLPHIALIQFEGEVTRGSSTADGTRLSEAIQKAMEDPLAHAVLIEANSPGGSPVQAEILHRTLMTMRETTNKPVFFSIGEMCASACLYVSSSADKVFAHRNSLIGSVGVRMDTWGFDKLIKNLQIERRTLSAGKNKALLDPFMPENPEAVKHLKNEVLAPLYVEFKNALIEGRGNKLATENPDLFTGYIWTGQDAVELGFADEIKTHYEIREMLRDTYQVSDIQNYTKPSFSMMKLLSSDFWAEVVSKAVTDIHGQQKLELN
ncbi:S49 family peptidase [Vibrio sp. SCSIO 43140]|uniref:S49 family peptidase n=1 Tax=Vibrio sp. SCSIO 43140 TaxID=2819100 RepID=UPI0020760628|nr:S49 family peptidase [Vibrio sp. SCSIO 43140]USD58931.1 S49 family peptidase [Vibrio sp. SCSIO 43140]